MRRKGFALVLALLISTLLLVLGMAFMTKQSYRYRLARLAADAVAAKALAMSGYENSRVKLEHDMLYPPPDQRYHDEYSYRETVHDLNSTTEVGSYEVTVDRRWMDPPYEVLVIISEGHPVESAARYRIRAEINLRPGARYFQVVRWEENSVY